MDRVMVLSGHGDDSFKVGLVEGKPYVDEFNHWWFTIHLNDGRTVVYPHKALAHLPLAGERK